MKTKPYEISGKDVPEQFHGKTIDCRDSETVDEIYQLVEDQDPDSVRFLAQSTFDTLVHRQITNLLKTERTKTILAGGVYDPEDGTAPVDYSVLSDEDRVETVLQEARTIGAQWSYKKSAPVTAQNRVNKQKASQLDALVAAAASDPALAAKLAALGIAA